MVATALLADAYRRNNLSPGDQVDLHQKDLYPLIEAKVQAVDIPERERIAAELLDALYLSLEPGTRKNHESAGDGFGTDYICGVMRR